MLISYKSLRCMVTACIFSAVVGMKGMENSAVVGMKGMENTVENNMRTYSIELLKTAILMKISPSKIQISEKAASFVEHMMFTPDGNHLIEARRGDCNKIFIINSDTKDELCHTEKLGLISSISCNNDYLVSGSSYGDQRNLYMWNIGTAKKIGNFSDKVSNFDSSLSSIRHVALHPSKSDFVSTLSGSKGNVFFHESELGFIKEYYDHDCVETLQYSPSGNYVVSVNREKTILSDACTAAIKKEIIIPGNAVAWSPDSSIFVVVSHNFKGNDNLFVCDGVTGEIIKSCVDDCDGRSWVKRGVQFSPDGKYLVTTSESLRDSSKSLITIRNGKDFKVIRIINSSLSTTAVDISYDSKYLIGNQNDHIFLYDFEMGKIMPTFLCELPCFIKWRPGTHQFVSTQKESLNRVWWNLFDKQTERALEDLMNSVTDEEFDFTYCALLDSENDNACRYKENVLYNALPESIKNLLGKMCTRK